MDFKNLMQLAKDKQSYLQQKHQQDKQAKVKQSNEKAKYRDEQSKALLEQKAVELQQRKEARILEARKKLIEKQRHQRRLDTAKNAELASHTSNKSKQTTNNQLSNMINGKNRTDKQHPKASNKNLGDIKKNGNGISNNGRLKDSKVRVVQNSLSKSQTKALCKTKNTSSKSNMSFADLMKIAQDQKNKPIVVKKEEQKPTNDQKFESVITTSTIKRKQQQNMDRDNHGNKSKPPQENETGIKARHTNRNDSNNEVATRKVFTQTLVNGPTPSSRQKAPMPSSNRHLNGNKFQSSNRNNQLKALDDELEQKRRDIERRKKKLENKYRHGYKEDEYDEYESYEDLDEDLDGFIDDSDSNVNVSKYIQQIFGYKRDRYADEDEDLRGMESNYQQIQREEARSTKIARMEDEIERVNEQKMLAAERKNQRKKK